MRTIQTFIVRLVVESEEPEAVRGVVRSITSDEEHTFTDGQMLLALLRQMSRARREPGSCHGEAELS